MTKPAGTGPPPPSLAFDPNAPINWTPIWHQNVTSYPWAANEPSGFRRAAGMFDASGTHLTDSHCWRYASEPLTIAPERDDSAAPHETLSGRWIFGGMFYAHFGHFLVETTQRLYALAEHADVDGIFFYPKMQLTREFKPLRPFKPIFAHLGLGKMAVRLPQHPVHIESIAFPPPAFGIGEMSAGRPEYRAFMRAQLTKAAKPEGARDLYITRSALNSRRGRIVQEEHLETLLAAEGYHIFHPEQHSFAEQLAHYQDYMRQFRAFVGIEPTRIEAIKGCWHRADRRFVKREVQAHLDFPSAATQLADAGFIAAPQTWADPSEEAMAQSLADLAERLGADLSYRDLR
jgi:hypothetical protein